SRSLGRGGLRMPGHPTDTQRQAQGEPQNHRREPVPSEHTCFPRHRFPLLIGFPTLRQASAGALATRMDAVATHGLDGRQIRTLRPSGLFGKAVLIIVPSRNGAPGRWRMVGAIRSMARLAGARSRTDISKDAAAPMPAGPWIVVTRGDDN